MTPSKSSKRGGCSSCWLCTGLIFCPKLCFTNQITDAWQLSWSGFLWKINREGSILFVLFKPQTNQCPLVDSSIVILKDTVPVKQPMLDEVTLMPQSHYVSSHEMEPGSRAGSCLCGRVCTPVQRRQHAAPGLMAKGILFLRCWKSSPTASLW